MNKRKYITAPQDSSSLRFVVVKPKFLRSVLQWRHEASRGNSDVITTPIITSQYV